MRWTILINGATIGQFDEVKKAKEMKIKQVKVFTPITITLESEFEARVLMTLAGSVLGDNNFRDVTDDIYKDLGELDVQSLGYYGNYFNSNEVRLEDDNNE